VTAQLFFQLLVNGLSIGLIYALVALGLILVLGVAKVFNFAHGDFFMVGAYMFYLFQVGMHLNFVASVVMAGLAVALLGALCNRTVFQFVSGSILKAAATTIGLGMIIQQAVLQLAGTAERGVKPFVSGVLSAGGVRVSLDRLVIIGICVLLMGFLAWFLNKTKTGIAMRATNLDEETAILQGINSGRMYLLAVTVGSGLAGAAGGIVAPIRALNTEMGHAMLFSVLMVVVLGGMQSALGAVIGGLILGIVLSFGFHFLGGLSELLTFFLIGLFVMIKPHGLFGKAIEVR
jgi:branched-chain amino acid transport system permease protein